MKNISLIITILIFCSSLIYANKKTSYYKEGEKLIFIGKYKEAIEKFNKSIEKKQELKNSYYYRGLAYLYLNNFPKAIDDFTEVINLDKNNADAYNNRGLTYSYIGNTLKALEDLDKAIELDENFAQAYLNRAGVFIMRTDFKNAIKDLEVAEKLDPNNPELHIQKGRVYYNIDDYEKSIKSYTKAIQLGLKNPKIYYNRANAFFKNKEYQKALEDYTKSIELNPDDLEALNNRAFVYKELGMDSLAKVDREKIKKIKGEYFTPIDSLKFKTFTNATKEFFIDLPDNWNLYEMPSEDGLIQFIITPEVFDADGSAMLVGVTVGIMKQMSKKFPVRNEPEILDFWKGSLDESNKDFLKYDVIWQKHMQWNNHPTILNQSFLQVGENFMPYLLYEYAIAYGNNLIYAYFQSPEFNFDYYKQIYDIAIKSIKLGDNFE